MNDILARHWSDVVRFAARFSGSADTAQDIAQEVFIRLWRGELQWSRATSLRAFLIGVARNLARNEGRRWWGRVLPLEGRREVAGTEARDSPSADLQDSEAQTAFRRAVAALPRRRQEIFQLAREHEMTYQEIATALGLSVQTVANQMSAALAQLRRDLAAWLAP